MTDYYLNPGTKLMVQGDKPTLHKFIINYSYRNLLFRLQRYFQIVDGIRDRIDHPSDLLTRKTILFSLLRSIGFTPIKITDLRLDILRLTTKGEELQFMIIFNTIDITKFTKSKRVFEWIFQQDINNNNQ